MGVRDERVKNHVIRREENDDILLYPGSFEYVQGVNTRIHWSFNLRMFASL